MNERNSKLRLLSKIETIKSPHPYRIELMEVLPHKQIGKKYGYIYLLISLMLMLVLFPFFNQSLFSQMLFNLFFSLTLIVSLYTISTTLKRFLLGVLFLVPSLITRWVTYLSSFPIDIIINHIVTFFFLCYIINLFS